MKTYGIIVAMDSEIKYLKKVLNFNQVHTYCNKEFFEGTYHNNKIIFATAGIGKVNAGITTALLIEHFNPEVIINTGIAGGYLQGIKTLDIVVANKVIYSDVDMTSPIAGAYKKGQLEGCPEYFIPSFELVENNNDLIFGTILTGDQFVDNYQKCENLVSQYFSKYDVTAFDMESGAIAQVCTMNKVKFIIIRAISDVIGSSNPFDYMSFSKKAVELVSKKVLEIIKK